MQKDKLEKLLNDFKAGDLNLEEITCLLKKSTYVDLGFAKLDTDRELRCGYPEVIYCEGKTSQQIVEIFKALSDSERNIMATRASKSLYDAVAPHFDDLTYHEQARIIVKGEKLPDKTERKIAVISAGTSDIPVAEEAAVTAETMGNPVTRLYDIGVAGIHRLFDNQQLINSASVIIVVAGMEGALASVIGGMVDKPVVAVPTSVGYGANFDGLAPLLAMLNSCAPGVAVMNIDNGYGAGHFASMVNQMERN